MFKIIEEILSYLYIDKKEVGNASEILVEFCGDYDTKLCDYAVFIKIVNLKAIESYLSILGDYTEHGITILNSKPKYILDFIKREENIYSFTETILIKFGKEKLLNETGDELNA